MTPYERARGLVTQLASSMAEFAGFGSVLRVLEFGSKKYPGSPWSRMNAHEHIAAALRHAQRRGGGIRFDEESGEPHLAHAIARLLFALAIDERNS